MKAIKGKVLIKIDTLQKTKYAFQTGEQIVIERGYNFNLREDRASMAYVIDSDQLPEGAPILVHHLSVEETYAVPYIHLFLTEEEIAEGYKIFSIPYDMVSAYFEDGVWKPCKDFLITQRIYEPYQGEIVGIPHQRIKRRLYVIRGEDNWDGQTRDLSGKVIVVLDNSDVEIIFHNEQHREERVMRTRHREILGIDEGMTKKVQKNLYLVGLSEDNCEPLNKNIQCQIQKNQQKNLLLQ